MATTTPNYGWPVPTSTDYVKDGATAIEALGDAIDATVFANSPGLTLIKTQTIGTAISSVTVTGAFSTTYDNYKIVIANVVASTDTDMKMTLNGSAGSTYNWAGLYQNYGTTSTNSGAATFGSWFLSTSGTSTVNVTVELQNPFLTSRSSFQANYANNTSNGHYRGYDNNAASSTAFTLVPSAGTYTGGTIAIYGYKK